MESRERTCLGCGELKPFSAFTPIRGTNKVYGRCKICRARQTKLKRAASLRSESAAGEPAGVRSPVDAARVSAGRSKQTSRRSRSPDPLVIANERTCTECGQTKSLSGYLPIKATKRGYYGRCRACRHARARARNGAHHVFADQVAAAKAKLGERKCTECGETKPLSGFLRIRATKTGYYGRCRACRKARARTRHHSNERARLAEIERSKRNSRRRKLLAAELAAA
jgi:predicted RNA-binding protein YlxR (DUF448 family)